MREMHSKRPKFSKFSGGACPRPPLEARALRRSLKTPSASFNIPPPTKRGEAIAHRSNEILAMKFKDKRDVPMLTTIHNEEMTPGRKLPMKNQNALSTTINT